MTTLYEFVEELKARRTGNGVLLTTFAGWLSVSKATLSRWENHVCNPSDDYLRTWAGLLSMDVPDGVKGRLVPQCGTNGGYKRHIYRGEETCAPCRTAHRVAHDDYVARRAS